MFTHPVPGPITSPYGWRVVRGVRNFHNGIDYGWLRVDPVNSKRVYAPTSGTVQVASNALVGNFVTMVTPVGMLRLAHFATVVVRDGQKVNRGDYLGVMGDTGSQASGVHLHVDLYQGSARVDPEPYFTVPFGSQLAGDGIPLPEKELMYSIIPQTDGKVFIASTVTGKTAHITQASHVSLLQRYRDNDSNDTMLAGEVAICSAYIAQIAPTAASVDYAKLAAEVAKLIDVPTAAENGAAARAAIVKP
jgi:hypothetical protein